MILQGQAAMKLVLLINAGAQGDVRGGCACGFGPQSLNITIENV